MDSRPTTEAVQETVAAEKLADATRGAVGTSSSTGHPNTRNGPPAASAAPISPTRLEVANRRFNETAPPMQSPTHSSPRPPLSIPLAAAAVAAASSSPAPAASAGATADSGQKARHGGDAVAATGLDGVTGQQQSSRHHAEHSETKHRTSGAHTRHSRPSHPGKDHRHLGHGTHCKRERASQVAAQRTRLRRSVAAAPKFGHPFASHPELPGLASSSVAESMPYVDWDHDRHSPPPREAAVMPATAAASGGGAAGGVGGGGSRRGSQSAPSHRLLHDRELVVGSSHTTTTAAAAAAAKTPAGAYAKTPIPLKASQLGGGGGSSSSGGSRLEDEGPLFSSREPSRHVHYYTNGAAAEEEEEEKHHHRRGGGEERSRSSSTRQETAGRRWQTGGARRGTHHHANTHEHHRQHHRRTTTTTGDDFSSRHNPTERSSDDNGDDSAADSQVTRDSFGYPLYHPIFRQGTLGDLDDVDRGVFGRGGVTGAKAAEAAVGGNGGGGGGGATAGGGGGGSLQVPTTTDVPWDLRNITEREVNKTFAFLSTRYFWFLIEYALRVTAIAMLVPAVLINLNLPYTPFVSPTFALTSVVIAVGTSFGQSCVFFVQYLKGGCIWLPLSTICVALKLNHYLAAWFVVYVVLLFLMAMFTEQTTRRMCLLLFNISMVSLLSGDESLVFPTRVLADWALGAAFALVATLIPYPMLATRFSAHITKIMFNNTATCFTGILSCFWAPSNTERSMSMVRIRSLVRTLDHLIEKFDDYDRYTFYEVLIYETSERREVRKEKVKLLLKLKMNLRAMERVINMVQEKPQMIDLSERCLLLRDHLSVPMDAISRSMEALLWKLSQAKKYEQLRTLSGYFEAAGRAMKRLQTEFDVGRRVLFYEHQEASMLHDGRMEEFVPLMTFFVFSIVNFWTTLEEFETFIDRHKPVNNWKDSFKLVFNALIDPFRENAELVRLLCVRRAEPEVRVVIEAAKVSVAMLISVIFFYYVDNQSLLLTGPSIIAFVSGTNPVEAVQAGAARMSGTLIGAVLGFFAASLCRTAVDRVAALCVITFVMTFFRPGQKFGVICMYCNFVAVSSLAPTEQTADLTISRIQQNTFAIFIYCFISVSVFPISPNDVLFQKRILVMQRLNTTMQKLASLFNDAARSYTETREEILRGAKTEDDVVNISNSGTVPVFGGLMAMHMPLNHRGSLPPSSSSAAKHGGANAADGEAHSPLANRNVIMPGVFTMAPQDTLVDNIFVEIFATMDTMKATSSVMPLAADEFQIIPHEYPLRASGDVHAALYRLCALVYTMACAWKTMREKSYFTTDMLHILHNLAPVANDIARCLDRFTHVMEFYVRFPSSGVSSELTKGAMQFRALCVELSARKERDLIAVIRNTILMKRVRNSNDDISNDGSSDETGGRSGSGEDGGDDNDSNGGRGSHPYTNRKGNGGGRGGTAGHSQRSPLAETGRRNNGHHSDPLRRGQKKSSGAGGRQRGSKEGRRSSSSNNGRYPQRHGASQSMSDSHNAVAALSAEQLRSREGDPLHASQQRAAAPFSPHGPQSHPPPDVTADRPHHKNNSRHQQRPAGDGAAAPSSASSVSTFKDSVMPRVDSRDENSTRLPIPIPGDSSWLPVPRDELPRLPSAHHHDEHQPELGPDEESGANLSPRSRVDGVGTVTNATRVFDSSVFPAPPLDDEQAAAVRRVGGKASLPAVVPPERPRSAPPTTYGDWPAPQQQQQQQREEGDGGGAGGQLGTLGRYPTSASSQMFAGGTSESSRRRQSSMRPHHHHHHPPHHRHPPRLVAHEECPPEKKSSALQRADRLRDHLRGMQRQSSAGGIARRHSSCEVRAFGASYTNIAGIDKAATISSHNPAHYHRQELPRQRSHHVSPHTRGQGRSHSSLYYEDDGNGDGRGSGGGGGRLNSRQGSGQSLEKSVPYGSFEGDVAQLEERGPCDSHVAHEPASFSSAECLTSAEARTAGDAAAAPPLSSRLPDQTAMAGGPYRSEDRITLQQSSSDDDQDEEDARHGRWTGRSGRGRERTSSLSSDSASSSSSSEYSSRTHGSTQSGSSSSDTYRSGDDDDDDDEEDESGTSSLVRFNDSFTTPITVQDAEGLHAFTLSLEMFGKELRRVLYGLEEMLQSL